MAQSFFNLDQLAKGVQLHEGIHNQRARHVRHASDGKSPSAIRPQDRTELRKQKSETALPDRPESRSLSSVQKQPPPFKTARLHTPSKKEQPDFESIVPKHWLIRGFSKDSLRSRPFTANNASKDTSGGLASFTPSPKKKSRSGAVGERTSRRLRLRRSLQELKPTRLATEERGKIHNDNTEDEIEDALRRRSSKRQVCVITEYHDVLAVMQPPTPRHQKLTETTRSRIFRETRIVAPWQSPRYLKPPGQSHSNSVAPETPARDVMHQYPRSTVRALAQTAVGQWMYKDTHNPKLCDMSRLERLWETPPQYGQLEPAAIRSQGKAKRRWVWLAPYERKLMWNSRWQNSTSNIFARRARGLPIISVLEIRNDEVFPGCVNSQLLPNRSILVLTPERLVRLTAPDQYSHQIWMRALRFVADSSSGLDEAAWSDVLRRQFATMNPHEAQQPETTSARLQRMLLTPTRQQSADTPFREEEEEAVEDRAETLTSQPQRSRSARFGKPLPPSPSRVTTTRTSMIPPAVPRVDTHNRRRSQSLPAASEPGNLTDATSLPPTPTTTASRTRPPIFDVSGALRTSSKGKQRANSIDGTFLEPQRTTHGFVFGMSHIERLIDGMEEF